MESPEEPKGEQQAEKKGENHGIELQGFSDEVDESMKIPIYSPRTTYYKIREQDEFFLNELMLKLDPFTVSILANDFKFNGGELKLEQFILMMKQHLKDWKLGIPNREYKLLRSLAILFDQIDLNLNGLLEWEELANYVLGKATGTLSLSLRGGGLSGRMRCSIRQ